MIERAGNHNGNGLKKIKVRLFEEDPNYRHQLRQILRSHDCLELAPEEVSPDILSLIRKAHPHLVFFSLEYDRQVALDKAKAISQIDFAPLLVLTTRCRQYPLEALDLRALDYLIKPFEAPRVAQTVQRVVQVVNENETADLSAERRRYIVCYHLRCPKERILVEASSVLFVYVKNNLIHVRTHANELITDWSLTELVGRFNPPLFCHTHKSYLINLDAVERIVPRRHGNYVIELRDDHGAQIPLSRRFVKSLREQLGW